MCVKDSESLFEATSQALLAGIDRDSYAGWGAVTYLLFVFLYCFL